jgi:G3E family GTPase
LIEQKHNSTILNCTTSTVQNYLDYRHNVTKEKLQKFKADQLKKELSKCTSKPVINKKSIIIAKRLQKNPVERLYRAKLEKNNEQALRHKRQFWEAENTFSPAINHQSRSLTRTVDDLYSWNERRENQLQLKKQQIDSDAGGYKIAMCPGSASIINNLDDLVDK